MKTKLKDGTYIVVDVKNKFLWFKWDLVLCILTKSTTSNRMLKMDKNKIY